MAGVLQADAVEAIVVIAALEDVAGHERIQFAPDVLDGQIDGLAALHPEALVETYAPHQLNEALGARMGEKFALSGQCLKMAVQSGVVESAG